MESSSDICIADLFDKFIDASTMRAVLSLHHRILNYSDLEPCEFNTFYPRFKKSIASSRQRKNWRAKAIFSKIDKKANHKCYSNTKTHLNNPPVDKSLLDQENNNSNNSDTNNHHRSINFKFDFNDNVNELPSSGQIQAQLQNAALIGNNALSNHKCLIIGAGPAGLRTAIELQLLGANKVVVAEKRSRFSRNNVVHLWPFVIDDLKSLGAKKFYGKFCAGSIDHISIRQLQLTLLKICLILGCDFRDSCSYVSLCPESIKRQEDERSARDKQLDTNKGDDNTRLKAATNCDSLINNCSGNPRYKTGVLEISRCDFDLIEHDGKQDSLRVTNSHEEFLRVSNYINVNDHDGRQNQNQNSNPDQLFVKSDENKPDSDISPCDNEDAASHHQGEQKISIGNGDNDHDHGSMMSKSSPDLSIPVNRSTEATKTTSISCDDIITSDQHCGTKVHFECDSRHEERELHNYQWDVIIGADGRRNTLKRLFPRKEFRGRLAIAITANFINRQSPTEAAVPEISGLSFIYNQEMFNALSYDTGIDLENICYYKDDTHYFVMTAKKKSLLERGVLLSDYASTNDLLADSNIDKEALLKFAKDAAFWTTGLEPLDFALNHYGQEDCAMFDFTSMYAAVNACKALRTKQGGLTLFGLVGDSLLEPFWPTGSGCARGFLSSFDAAWMCRQWAVNKCATNPKGTNHQQKSRANHSDNRTSSLTTKQLTHQRKDRLSSGVNESNSSINRMATSVIAERESIYRILAQTTSENLQQNYSHWTLNPHTRYPNLNRHHVLPCQVEHLIVDDEKILSRPNGIISPHTVSRSKKLKSPLVSARRSPKKLKSANSSPNCQHKNYTYNNNKQQQQSTGARLSSTSNRFKSKLDTDNQSKIDRNDVYWEFESSYRDLADNNKSVHLQYLNRNHEEYSIYATTKRRSSNYNNVQKQTNHQSHLQHSITNNLYDEEMARRARDIDDCIKLRRQRSQLSVVRDKLIQQFRGQSVEPNRQESRSKSPVSAESAAILNELRRLRDQRSMGKENLPNCGSDRPLFLLNSIRRCASFAERVKSFEGKSHPGANTINPSGEGAGTTRPTIDNVKNLPQFATLQRLLANQTSGNGGSFDSQIKQHQQQRRFYNQQSNGKTSSNTSNNINNTRKSKIPIMKLSKDDWNVRCWEERLAAYENRSQANNLKTTHNVSSKSLHKSHSQDPSFGRAKASVNGGQSINQQANKRVMAEKQVQVFKDRIKEMAIKLEIEPNSRSEASKGDYDDLKSPRIEMGTANETPRGAWVSHLRQELIKSTQLSNKKFQNTFTHPNNKPIKKLFEKEGKNARNDYEVANDEDNDLERGDDDDDDDDDDKHYDHLCINRPINKYLVNRNGPYKGHLVRTRYDEKKSIVLNRPISNEAKQAYLCQQTASMNNKDKTTIRASSVSSSDSTNTSSTNGNTSSNSESSTRSIDKFGEQQHDQRQTKPNNNTACSRCLKRVDQTDGIRISNTILHRACLNCSLCSITLRTTEIQYYLDRIQSTLLENNGNQKNSPPPSSSPQITETSFLCAICKPSIRHEMGSCLKSVSLETKVQLQSNSTYDSNDRHSNHDKKTARMRPSDDFLIQKINYNELYKTIVDSNIHDNEETSQAIDTIQRLSSRPLRNQQHLQKQHSEDSKQRTCQNTDKSDEPMSSAQSFKIAKSESINGSELVTLVLPNEDNYCNEELTFSSSPISNSGSSASISESVSSTSSSASSERAMLDEDELQRILHLNTKPTTTTSNLKEVGTSSKANNWHPDAISSASISDDSDENRNGRGLDTDLSDEDDENRDIEQEHHSETFDDSSSLDSPQSSASLSDDDEDKRDGNNENDSDDLENNDKIAHSAEKIK